jgi:ATP-dependent DNA helicase RecG
MDLQIVELSNGEKRTVLATEEGHFADVKSKQIAPAKLSRTISAFANASGGDIYIGIDEVTRSGRRSWNGFANQEDANAHIALFDDLYPLSDGLQIRFLRANRSRGLILSVNCPKTRKVIRASDGIPYVRRGGQNIPQKTQEKIRALELAKGLESFETDTVDVSLIRICKSPVLKGFVAEVVPRAKPRQWLDRQLLIRDGKPTVAAVLLYDEEPQAILPKRCGLKIFRYKTTEAEGTRESLAFQPITIEGSLYSQIAEAVGKTAELVEDIQILGPQGLENIEYPEEALHEIITNAVIHRDYSIATDIQIRIFDNRVEVESPGRLPAHITPDNILQEQFARNGQIVRLINKFPNPPNKDVGEGLNTAFSAMRQLKLKDPVIDDTDSGVVVAIRHERLASPESIVMDYLESHDEINNRTARSLTAITSENVMKDVFYRLCDRGKIERVPNRHGAAAAWRKTKK